MCSDISMHSTHRGQPFCLESFSEMRAHPATHRATPGLAACNARALHSFDAALPSVLDNIAPLSRAVFRLTSVETRRATAPAWDRSNIFRSIVAALRRKPPDAQL